MLKKEYNARKKEIRDSMNDDPIVAFDLAIQLIENLSEEKQYDLVCDLYGSKFIVPKEALFCFDLAYALNNQRKFGDARTVYEELLSAEPTNTSILNNLHLLFKRDGKLDEAWNLIRKANDLNPNDEIISNNYNYLAEIILARDEKNALFKSAVAKLERENNFVLGCGDNLTLTL